MNKILEIIKKGTPIYIEPYKQPKVWGIDGVGEYWYGAEKGEKSSIAVSGRETASMADVIESISKNVLGKAKFLPLVKILTPKKRLSVQFHDTKNELWIITGIDKKMAGNRPCVILGFNPESIRKYAGKIRQEYKKTLQEYAQALNQLIDIMERNGHIEELNKKSDVIEAAILVKEKDPGIGQGLLAFTSVTEKVMSFYNYRQVALGDVIPIPAGTLHALGAGVEIVEPQIPGETQSLEDGATYPVRYYFPGYNRPGAQKKLDIDRVDEIHTDIVKEVFPEIISKATGYKIERLPGNFEDKGLEVNRINVNENKEVSISPINSFHSLVLTRGKAKVLIKEHGYDIPKASPGGRMLLIPACAKEFVIKTMGQDAQIIDTFTPV